MYFYNTNFWSNYDNYSNFFPKYNRNKFFIPSNI